MPSLPDEKIKELELNDPTWGIRSFLWLVLRSILQSIGMFIVFLFILPAILLFFIPPPDNIYVELVITILIWLGVSFCYYLLGRKQQIPSSFPPSSIFITLLIPLVGPLILMAYRYSPIGVKPNGIMDWLPFILMVIGYSMGMGVHYYNATRKAYYV